jgi:CO dehydrogenase/acetyl-CoA synthase delta subunit
MHDSQTARVSTPLLFPGGTMIGVEFSRLRDGFLVTDAGAARREAGMLGGERTFVRLAGDVAQRYGVRFDQNMIFDMEVAPDELAVAIISVANAAKSAVEMTALHLATTEHSDYRAMLWSRLERIYEPKFISRNLPVRGSSDEWRFDAVVNLGSNVALFELVAPHPNAVSSAVTKFLDIRDLGEGAPQRIAVLTNKDETPHLPVLARTARVVSMNDPDDIYRQAA